MKIETKKWFARLLLGFVLVSIGYALGKEATLRRLSEPAAESTAAEQTRKPEHPLCDMHEDGEDGASGRDGGVPRGPRGRSAPLAGR